MRQGVIINYIYLGSFYKEQQYLDTINYVKKRLAEIEIERERRWLVKRPE